MAASPEIDSLRNKAQSALDRYRKLDPRSDAGRYAWTEYARTQAEIDDTLIAHLRKQRRETKK
jgi:hypothetical protein